MIRDGRMQPLYFKTESDDTIRFQQGQEVVLCDTCEHYLKQRIGCHVLEQHQQTLLQPFDDNITDAGLPHIHKSMKSLSEE